MTEQKLIIGALGVAPSFDVKLEANRRIDFLGTYLRASGLEPTYSGLAAAWIH